MNQNPPRSRVLRRGVQGGSAVVGALVVCGLWMGQRSPHFPPDSHSRKSLAVTPAKYQGEPPAEPAFLDIHTDATQNAPEDPNALRTLEEAIARIAPSSDPAPVGDSPAGPPAWQVWGRLATIPAPVTAAPDTALLTGAVHSAQGMTLCLVNRSTEKKQLRVQIRLPRGVYRCERLTFSPPNLMAEATQRTEMSGATLQTAAAVSQAEAMAHPLPAAQLERLQGPTFTTAAVIRKRCTLLPGQVCLYRYTDVSQAARAALNETYDRLHEMALDSPGPARRLRHILEEADGVRGSLSPGNGKSASARLSGIHRLLLVTAQVQSMQRNYQQRHNVNAKQGAALMGALERLTDALAETSATLLEFVPQIAITESETAPATNASPVANTPPPSHSLLVTMSLTNLGNQSASMVKLGLDTASLPAGVVCEPDDPAYFGAVHPGQSVRAAFRLRCPAGSAIPANRFGGDVSYFVSGAPAHLRLRAW